MHNKEDQYKELLAGLRPPQGLSNDEAWKRLQARIQQEETPVVELKPARSRWWVAAAAVVVLAVGAFVLWPADGAVSVLADHPQTITLPDGSEVTLNSGASVSYDTDTWEQERLVSLKGEGFFEVEKGSSFEVRTAKGSVFVLGTSFNVNTDGSFEVDCFTGKVGVESPSGSVELTPGECAVMRNGLLVETTFEPAGHAWQTGKFMFVDAPLTQVCSSLAKAFGVSIELELGESEEIPGIDLDVNTQEQSLEEVLSVLQAYGFVAERQGSIYRLAKN